MSPQGRLGSRQFRKEPESGATLLLMGAGMGPQGCPGPSPPGAGPLFISCLPVYKQEGSSDGVGAALQLFGDTHPRHPGNIFPCELCKMCIFASG